MLRVDCEFFKFYDSSLNVHYICIASRIVKCSFFDNAFSYFAYVVSFCIAILGLIVCIEVLRGIDLHIVQLAVK